MREKLPYIILAVCILGAVGGGWYFWNTSSGGSTSGFPMVCPSCEAFFRFSQEEILAHPKGPNGEGFKCDKCGKFGVSVASRCDKCGQWMIPVKDEHGAESCPKCAKPAEAKKPTT